VALDAECYVGTRGVVIGKVRDVSRDGFFFEPLGGVVDGWVERNDTVIVPVEERVRVTMPGIEIGGTVRWVGHSLRHATWGFGLEFDQVFPPAWLAGLVNCHAHGANGQSVRLDPSRIPGITEPTAD